VHKGIDRSRCNNSGRSQHPTLVDRQKIQLNNIMNEMDLTDIYRVFHPTATDNTFFPVAHRNFSKIYHILGPTANLNKYTRKSK
jgi:hypothetical protein